MSTYSVSLSHVYRRTTIHIWKCITVKPLTIKIHKSLAFGQLIAKCRTLKLQKSPAILHLFSFFLLPEELITRVYNVSIFTANTYLRLYYCVPSVNDITLPQPYVRVLADIFQTDIDFHQFLVLVGFRKKWISKSFYSFSAKFKKCCLGLFSHSILY